MRTRITSTPLTGVSNRGDYLVHGVHYAYFGPYTWHYTATYERIDDYKGHRWLRNRLGGMKTEFRNEYRPCHHVKWSYTPLLSDPWAQINSISGIFINGNAQMIGWGLRNSSWDAGSQLAGLVLDIPGPVTQHFADGFRACKPSMASRANMSVFLYELRDIRRMFNLLPFKHIKRVRSWGDVLVQLAKYGNGLHLNYNFGWKPFISDCKAVGGLVASFDARLAKFVNNANRSLTRHFRVPDVALSGEIADFSPPDGWFFLQPYSGTARFSSCFDYTYAVPEYSPNELRFRAWADALNLKLTLANIWEVLPWSFVIDWFVDVGSYLEQYSQDWLAPWLNLSQACCSLEWDCTVKRIRNSPYSANRCPSQVGQCTVHKFVRHVGAPHRELATGNLDADKIRLLASLIGARL